MFDWLNSAGSGTRRQRFEVSRDQGELEELEARRDTSRSWTLGIFYHNCRRLVPIASFSADVASS